MSPTCLVCLPSALPLTLLLFSPARNRHNVIKLFSFTTNVTALHDSEAKPAFLAAHPPFLVVLFCIYWCLTSLPFYFSRTALLVLLIYMKAWSCINNLILIPANPDSFEFSHSNVFNLAQYVYKTIRCFTKPFLWDYFWYYFISNHGQREHL